MTTSGLFHAAAEPSDEELSRFVEYTNNHPASDALPATWDAIFSLSDASYEPDVLIIMDLPPAGQEGPDLELSMAGTKARFSLVCHQPGAYSIVATDKNLEMRKIEVATAPGEDQKQAMTFISWAIENCPAENWPKLEARLVSAWEYIAEGVRHRNQPDEPDAAPALPVPSTK